jgi:hypothetical protein
MKDIPTSPRIARIKHNRRVKRLRLIVLSSILFISIIAGLSYFSSYHRITINKIIISGNSIVNSQDMEARIRAKLAGRYIGLFSRSNFLIYPQKKIYNDLVVNFPRIESLAVTREGLNTLHVSLTERAGSFLYCGLAIPDKKEDVGENCYFVNNNGYIFDKAPYFSGDVYFKYYTAITGDISNPLGTQMLTEVRFHDLVRFIDGVSALGFKPTSLTIDTNGTHSLYLKSANSKPNPKIVFKADNNLSIILDNFITAMSKKEFANEINSKYDTLSYIDLRFKNKVLYKFQ